MNDRFRFRIPVTNLDGQFDRFIFCDVYHEPIHFIGSAIFLTPEQCTGLKDNNGNLIYEGDIIAVANGSINGNVCISKWEVVWIENEGRYSVPFWVADKPNFSHYVKVLGNVHENPELLEDK